MNDNIIFRLCDLRGLCGRKITVGTRKYASPHAWYFRLKNVPLVAPSPRSG